MEYTEKQLELLGKFKALWDELGSQSKACERVGISEQIMSSLRSGKYNGDCDIIKALKCDLKDILEYVDR